MHLEMYFSKQIQNAKARNSAICCCNRNTEVKYHLVTSIDMTVTLHD